MTTQEKLEIQILLKGFVAQHPSQKQAAAHIFNCSEATVSNILANKWDAISDDMWRNVSKQLGWTPTGEWKQVDTLDYKTITTICEDAKKYSNVFALVGPAGAGKTFAANKFKQTHRHVFHINCSEYWNRKMFLSKILEAMGRDNTGYHTGEMMDYIVELMFKLDRPLLILDEADKLTDRVLYFFITLYNLLKGKCGLIMMSTPFLKARILRGVKMNRKGYDEIYSRIGRTFISLHGVDKKEVTAICVANGIDQELDHSEIFNDCDKDLRRVERLVHKKKLKSLKAA